MVEGQHRVSTLKLADTLADQALLEEILEDSKPPVPPPCRHLHYLLSTPFRYGAPYPRGSRFRRAGLTPGVFYASRLVATAVAETAFHRLLFFADSPATPWPVDAAEYTAFSVRFRTVAGLDLTAAPFDAERHRWTDPTDYAATQGLADAAREAGVQVLRYRSARDPKGTNLALLSCAAFAGREPAERQTWRIHLGAAGVRAVSQFPGGRLEFNRGAFAEDPRIVQMVWDR